MDESFFSDFGLLWYLKELRKEEFWKFKELLKEEPLKLKLNPIPWPDLKKASREGIAALLDKHYSGKQAWEVTLSLFLQVNRRDLWTKAQDEIRSKLNPYKSRMREKFRCLWEKETCLQVPEESYRASIKKEYEQLHEAFMAGEDEETSSVTVVLYGPGGAGKTTFLRKVMLEWAEGKLWKERFAFVFFLNVDEMNNIAETSLAQLLSKDWPESSESVEDVFSQPQRVLFVMDGFEELKFYLDLNNLCSDWRQRQPTPTVLGSLLRRKMLPESSLLMALGATGMMKYFYVLQYPQYIVLQRLSTHARKLYFSHFFGEKHHATRAFSFVKDQTKLFLLCQYPLQCWLVCSCLKWQLERGEDFGVTAHSSTSLYVSCVASVLKSGLQNLTPRQIRARLKALCTLAAEGTWVDTFVFRPEDLQRNEISETDTSMWVGMGLLRRNEDRVTFTHVCLQGFFAALWYLLRWPHKLPHPTIRSVSQVVEATVTLAPSYLVQTGFFLFGLSAEEMTSALETALGVSLSKEIQPEIVKCLWSLSQGVHTPALVRFKELFNSLFETREEEFVAQVMSFFQNIDIYMNHTDDLIVSAFCLKHSRNLQQLHLSIECVFPDDREHVLNTSQKLSNWRDLCSVFTASSDFQVLDLDNCIFDDASHAVLWKALAQPNCKLQKYNYASSIGKGVDFFRAILHNPHLIYLNLHGTNLSREEVKKLCETLRHPLCNIEELMLGKCDISEESCVDITTFLVCNKKLKLLSLIENPLRDEGILVLCNALKHPACTLEKLHLKFCCLTSATCDYISEVLLCSKSLSILDLGSNVLEDKGVECLCKILRYPSCILQELWLASCFLTPVCCRDLSSLLISNTQLKTLKLKNNRIEDAGVKQLCAALKHPNCKLEKLGLDMCELTAACCEDLASMLTLSKSLKSLNLDWNNLGHRGVVMLCEALSHPDCVLELLGLDRYAFEEEIQLLLKAVEQKKPQLSILHQPWETEEGRMQGVLL